MKTSDLMKLVDALVDAKVKKLLPRLVTEEVSKQMKSILTEITKPSTPKKHNDMLDDDFIPDMSELLGESRTETQPVKKTVITKTFSKNPTLNAILNETANNPYRPGVEGKEDLRKQLEEQIRRENATAIYGDSTYEEDIDETVYVGSGNMSQIAARSMGRSVPMQKPMNREEIQREVLKKELEMQTASVGQPKFDVTSLMARDYRQVLKATEEKAKSQRPS